MIKIRIKFPIQIFIFTPNNKINSFDLENIIKFNLQFTKIWPIINDMYFIL